MRSKECVCAEAPNLHLLGCSLLGHVGEHGSTLGRLKVPGARLLKQSLGLRAAHLLARRKFGRWRNSLLHGALGLEGCQLLRGG